MSSSEPSDAAALHQVIQHARMHRNVEVAARLRAKKRAKFLDHLKEQLHSLCAVEMAALYYLE
jgi:hypothetical protein